METKILILASQGSGFSPMMVMMVLVMDENDDDEDDNDDGSPAHFHHDKNSPSWEFVSNEYGGNMLVTKSHHMIMKMGLRGRV